MSIEDAIAYLWLHGYQLKITMRYARVYLRGKWVVRVRAQGLESLAKMIIRLALKAKMQEEFKLPPRPKQKPSARTKAHLRRIRRETLPIQ